MGEQDIERDDLATDDDVLGHHAPTLSAPGGAQGLADEDEDDVEAHIQPPRGDDTDQLHSIILL